MPTYSISEYAPHPGQLELHRAEDKEILVVSAIRAGKSHGIIFDAICSAWNNQTNWGTLITAPTYRLVDSVLERPIVNRLLAMGLLAEHSFSRHESTLKNGKVIYYRSLDDPDLALRGLNIYKAYIDEAAYCSKYAVDVVKGRLLTSNGQLVMITTPNGQTSWMYDEYIVNKKDNVKYINFKLTDNPIITSEAIERLYESYDPILAKQELEGEWVNLFENQIYYAFSDLNLDTFEADDSQVYIGLDFNIDKNAWVAIQKMPNNTFRVIGEGYGDKTTADVATTLLTTYPDAIVIPDATGSNRLQGTGKTNFQLLRQAGVHKVVERKSNPHRSDRYAIVNATFLNALNQRRLFIDEKKCPRLVRELRELSYRDKTIKVEDKGGEVGHITDALGYAIVYLTGRSVGKLITESNNFIEEWKARKLAYDNFSI